MAEHLGESAEREGFVGEYSEEIGIDAQEVLVIAMIGTESFAQHGAQESEQEPECK